MKFKTPYEVSDEFFTESGEFTRKTYKAVLQKDGEYEIVEDGIELTYEKIQSYKDSVDINVIVKRYKAGDTYALEQVNGVYEDFVSVPKSYMEVLNSIVDARNAYEKSDMDISFNDFVQKALKPISKPFDNKESEVIDNEQKSE